MAVLDFVMAANLATKALGLFNQVRGATAANKPQTAVDVLKAIQAIVYADPRGDFTQVPASVDEAFNLLRGAVELFQGDWNVPQDGVIDEDAIAKLLKQVTPCLGSSGAGSDRKPLPQNLGILDPKGVGDPRLWFFYEIQGLPEIKDSNGESVAKRMLKEAFIAWLENLNVWFEEKEPGNNATTNLVISHEHIDGPGGILALGTVGSGGNVGSTIYTLKIDNEETWTPAKFKFAMCHELGHILGLEHTTNPGDLMFDTVQLDANNEPAFSVPQPRDIGRAQLLWGKAPVQP
jgi:hypothetical protein